MLERMKLAAISLTLLMLAGCTGGPGSPPGSPVAGGNGSLKECSNLKTADNKNVTDADGTPHPDLIEFLIKGLAVDPSSPDAEKNGENPFDKFLDCYVGPVDAQDLEQRLLRGHIVVTMLAMYGDYNVRSQPYGEMVEDARTILGSTQNAAVRLSMSSNVIYKAAGNTGNLPQTPLPSFERVDRVFDVLQLAIDVERPTIARTRSAVLNLIAAIGGSPGALRDLIGNALTGIRKATVLAVYGSAIRNDAYRFLGGVKRRGTVTVADWQAWDHYLHGACSKLAELSAVVNRCVPSAAAIKQAFSSGPGSRTATP